MELFTILWCALMFYIILYYVNLCIKAKYSEWHSGFMYRNQLHIALLNVRWSTTVFNNFFNKLIAKHLTFFRVWFNIGTILTLMLIIPSMILLLVTAFNSISTLGSEIKEETILQPVIPGLNLPKSEFLHYIVTLFTCTIIHEFGHAFAAVREQVPVLGMGFTVLFVLPAAFVELPTDNVLALPTLRQIKIYCAGVWHNIVLSVAAFFLLISLSFLATPLFSTGTGIYVYGMSENYMGAGTHDFQIGDVLTQVDECSLINSEEWRLCLTKILQEKPLGFCVKKDFLSQFKPETATNSVCCDDEHSQSHLCFLTDIHKESQQQFQYCLRGRSVIETSMARCHLEQCMEHHVCLSPILQDQNASEWIRLVQIQRHNNKPVVFLGEPNEIFESLYVSDYVPRTFLSPIVMNFIDQLLRYIISFSAGLAMLNVVPCVALDGQYICDALCQLLPNRRVSSLTKDYISRLLVFFGTSLVIVNIIFGFYSLI